MYVCICNAVSDSDINRAIENGADTLDLLRECLNVANSCGHCSTYIEARMESKIEQAQEHLLPHKV
jgi:bacterioferritin-associated ferredoxin